MKAILILHRYLGVVVGLLMALWCLSGFVMMYSGYPQLSGAQKLKGLPPLNLASATPRPPLQLADDSKVTGFRLQMMSDRPVLLVGLGRRQRLLDLTTGTDLDEVDAPTALAVASAFAKGNAIAGKPHDLGVIDDDQWTVEGAEARGPVRHIRFDDPAATHLYIPTASGEPSQITTGRTRFWGWLGAVPHWLFPTVLKRNNELWTQVVIYASLIGVFLTATGLFVGITRFRRYKSGRWSPYRGWFYWHHIAGLVFGILTLTWVGTGLLTMNPWGYGESDVGQAERAGLAGTVTGADLKQFLAAAPSFVHGDLAQLNAATLGGKLYVMAVQRDGTSQRLNAQGAPAPLQELELTAAMKGMGGPAVAKFTRMAGPDAYYYTNYDRPAVLPAYRADTGDARHSTYYIDAASGRMVFAIDDGGRQSRWIRTGLHDFDFAWMRARPIWDVIVLILLAGVTGTCITGAWLSIKRVIRDAKAVASAVPGKAPESKTAAART